MQDALVLVLARYPRFVGLRGPAYSKTVLARLAYRSWRRPELPSERLELLSEASGRNFTDDLVLRSVILAALEQLPTRQRACVYLRFIEGLDDWQMSRVLGCRAGDGVHANGTGLEEPTTNILEKEPQMSEEMTYAEAAVLYQKLEAQAATAPLEPGRSRSNPVSSASEAHLLVGGLHLSRGSDCRRHRDQRRRRSSVTLSERKRASEPDRAEPDRWDLASRRSALTRSPTRGRQVTLAQALAYRLQVPTPNDAVG